MFAGKAQPFRTSGGTAVVLIRGGFFYLLFTIYYLPGIKQWKSTVGKR
jgi:hypothetical protein